MSKFLALGLPLDDVVRAVHLEPGARDQAGGARPPVRGRGADVAVLRLEKGSFGFVDSFGGRLPRHAEARVRDDAARRQGRVRPQRPRASGLGDPAQGLQDHGRPTLVGSREVSMAKSNRRSFLAKAPAAGPRGRRGHRRERPGQGEGEAEKEKTGGTPVKKVHWKDGKRPEKHAALQRDRLLRQPALHLGHRRPLRGRHQGPHRPRAEGDPAAPGIRRARRWRRSSRSTST